MLHAMLFLFAFLLVAACVQLKIKGSTPNQSAFIEEATISGLQALMESGQLTSRQLCEAYLSRIEALDHSGPGLGSILELNPEALQIADALAVGRPRIPIFSIEAL